MRLLAIAATAARGQLRNPWLPLLVIGLGPFFVVMTSLFFPSGGTTSYPVAVVNTDAGPLGADVVAALKALRYDSGGPILEVTEVPDAAAAKASVEARRAVVFVDLPASFSDAAAAAGSGASVQMTMGGDLGSPTYPVVAIMVATVVEQQVQRTSGRASLVQWNEVALGASGSRSEFELYVPGVLIFAIGMIMFSAAMSVAEEIESGTVHRLVRTRARAAEILGGHALVQVALALVAGGCSLAVALALGFHSAGPLWLAIPIWILASLGVIGVGLLVAAFSKSVAQAFLLANFPFGLFMFLSGTAFPVRGWPLFSVGGHQVNALDLLPTRHAVNALTAVFSYGSTDVVYELSMLTLLSLGFFVLGAWVFHRRHLRLAA